DASDLINDLTQSTQQLFFWATRWPLIGDVASILKSWWVDLDYLDLKLNFALEVARGLNFLVSVQILHHDIRCKGCESWFTDATRNIRAVFRMAPEKLLNMILNIRYTDPCNPIDDEFDDQAIPISFAEFNDILVEKAIKEYRSKDGNNQNTWKCFEAHANAEAADGDIKRESTQNDMVKAVEYFKKAVNNGN
ncbi:2383_t:CDS:2, partial [Dentiscutata heterogama]